VRTVPEEWVLTEGTVPESIKHDDEAGRIKLILEAWARRSSQPTRIARNLAIRWLEADPRIGIDPDVCVLAPPPPDVEAVKSLRLWVPGHVPPRLCFEIVSENHPHKDYRDVHERYAAIRTDELVVFDPELCGPRALGGPVLLQQWRRNGELFERVHFGDGPVHSPLLDAWIFARDGHLLFAEDRDEQRRWLTGEEYERSQKEYERSQKELERARRVELERQLEELRTKTGS
jgi:hypothetical protein